MKHQSYKSYTFITEYILQNNPDTLELRNYKIKL